MPVAKFLMLLGALSLAVGCSSWRRIPVEREAILSNELVDQQVRFTTAEGQFSMVVTGLHMPPGTQWFKDGYLRGLDNGVRTTVYFDAIAKLEARSVPFYEREGYDQWVAAVLGIVIVAGLVALAIWAAHEWDDDYHDHYHY